MREDWLKSSRFSSLFVNGTDVGRAVAIDDTRRKVMICVLRIRYTYGSIYSSHTIVQQNRFWPFVRRKKNANMGETRVRPARGLLRLNCWGGSMIFKPEYRFFFLETFVRWRKHANLCEFLERYVEITRANFLSSSLTGECRTYMVSHSFPQFNFNRYFGAFNRL